MTEDNQQKCTIEHSESGESMRTNAGDLAEDQGRYESDLVTHFSSIQAVQIALLQREQVIDESAANVILRIIDSVHMGYRHTDQRVWAAAAMIEERIEAALPPEISGAASLGRTRSETIATALRMLWRARTADIAGHSLELRASVHELAGAHTVTVMGAFADRKAAAPTTLAHFLGGVLGPLESTWKRLLTAIDSLDRSPLGAGLVVGEVFGVDRTQSASLLGFREPIENTIDAAGSVEDIAEALEAIAAQAAVVRRFVTELLVWIRTDPTSFFIDERWESVPEPAHPAHAVSTRLEQLNYRAQHAEVYARSVVVLLRSQPYGPIGVAWDLIAQSVDGVLGHGEGLLQDATAAVREALIVNRAYLANRAGRLYSTASDVAAFLMEDQQLSPAAAQRIAGLAIARLKEASLEAAQITPDIIDSAAVLVIGQELKVEMETLGRYIAPRRYIERRDVLGSPKADRTRTWLANVVARIQQDRVELEARTHRWHEASQAVTAMLAESAESQEY